MIPVPANVRVWIATGHTDMRRGMTGLALQVQEILKRDPHAGDIYLFRGKRGDLMKCLWHDGLGLSLDRVPPRGVGLVFLGRAGYRDQAAKAGMLTSRSLLNGVMVSRVM